MALCTIGNHITVLDVIGIVSLSYSWSPRRSVSARILNTLDVDGWNDQITAKITHLLNSGNRGVKQHYVASYTQVTTGKLHQLF